MNGKNVLVTGATGFLGGAVCRRLAQRGWRVTATGRNAQKGHELTREGFVFRQLSLDNRLATAGLCDRQDAVVHCAALSSPWGKRQDFHSANVTATENLLGRATEARISRFIHISTPSVYFDFRHRLDLTETSPLASRPANDYAATKLAAERLVLAAAASGLPAIILRPRAIFGPGDTTIFPRLLRAASMGRLPIIGDGRTFADLTYIENAAHAVECALNARDGCCGQVFNITDGQPVVLWTFLHGLLQKLGIRSPRRRLPVWAALALATLDESVGRLRGKEPMLTRYGVGALAYSQTFDISATKHHLGYDPELTTEEGAERLASYLKEFRGGAK